MIFADLSFPSIPFSNLILATGILLLVAVVLGTSWVLLSGRRVSKRESHHWFSRLTYAIFIASICVLSASSFVSILQFGHMSGLALLAHVSAAGVFVFVLVAIAILYLPSDSHLADESIAWESRWWVARWTAWLLVVSSIVAAGTMFVSMLPLLDTEGLVTALELHRYAGLAVVIGAVLHLYALLITRLGFR
jgi:hypothetical protein